MNYILFDDVSWENILPLTYTRPVSELRIGILTIREKWEKILNSNVSYLTKDYLQLIYKTTISEDNILINSSYLPTKELTSQISKLELNSSITHNGNIVAIRLNKNMVEKFDYENPESSEAVSIDNLTKLNYSWDIFSHNEEAIRFDFDLITKGRTSAPISESNTILGQENIFVEEGANIEMAIINATSGKVYIGSNVTIGEGSVLKGSIALCENSVVSMGSRISGATTLGPHSKFGGEIGNIVVFGYSNKAHDGYIGNAVIGEWCNLGAGTNCSNLKNDYTPVKVWNYPGNRFMKTNLQFCGPIIGDHSKCAINSMLNTGTTLGVGVNIVRAGFPRNFVPSFSQGGLSGFVSVNFKTFVGIAQRVMARREKSLSEEDISMLEHIYNTSEDFRNY